MSLLEVHDLTIAYAESADPAVQHLSFALDAGESLGLAGESGSGKTQTALSLLGLLPAHAKVSGTVRFDGAELIGRDEKFLNRFRARRVAMVFQDPMLALNPYLQIGEQLGRVLVEHGIARGKAAVERSLGLLRQVGLPDAEREYRSYPHQLSGGMRQRAMIALALSCEPERLVADEPTTALDVTVQAQILALLQELRSRSGIGLLLITHDLAVIAENCERTMVMHRGRLLEQGTTIGVFTNPSQEMTRAMLVAAPRIDATPPLRTRAEADAAPVLRVADLQVTFKHSDWRGRPGGRRANSAVRGVSFALERGETLAIVGESGSGKTTAARAIVGLTPRGRGEILLNGRSLAPGVRSRSDGERRALQMVFQDPLGSLDPAMRIASIIAEPVVLHEPQLNSVTRHERVIAALGRVGLDESLMQRFPHELSGGQAQRVAIARALVLEPAVLICDEAVAALDGTVRRAILQLLQAEQERSGLALVFISHDLAVVRQISHRVLVMYMGRVVELADNAALFERPRHPYTRALLDSVPVPDPSRGPRPVRVAGELAAFVGTPSGCPFHPRCAFALPLCREERPRLESLDGVAVACHRAGELDLRR